MKRLIILGAVWALAVARPELYKEKEDFQYSRSSSDDGSKSGYYGAQRGNMGGNYERAHNMDSLAQNQMSGLVRQVEGELGDGAKTRAGSVYTAASSRGTYGSGHFDLSNLEGRNFQEGTFHDDSQSRSSLSSSSAYNAAGYTNSRSQNSRRSGYQAAGSSGLNMPSDDLQSLDNSQGTGQYDYGRQSSHSAGYNAQSGFQQHSTFDTNNANAHYGGYGSNTHTRLISATPVRIIVRPGTRVAIPVAAQTYDITHGSSLIDQNSLNSDAEILSNDNQQSLYRPTNAKHYESSYNYRKEWEKHDTIPSAATIPTTPTENPFPKNSELYEDSQARVAGGHYDAARVDSQRAQSSNAYGGYNVKSASSHSLYDTQHHGSSLHSNTNAHTLAGYNAGYNHHTASSDSSLSDNIQSQYNAGSRYHVGVADSNSLTQAGYNTGFNADLNSQVENLNTKPKSYQSSYSYHKSWEHQGDPYVIKPASSAYYDGQSAQRLTTGSTKNQAYAATGSHYQHSHQSGADCDENCHIRVARSYNTDQYQDMQQQSQNIEDMGQQVQDLDQQSQNQWEQQKVGQQTQNTWDYLEDLSKQSHNQWDAIHRQWDRLEDLGQTAEINWGQKPQSNNYQLEDIQQKSQNDLGQHIQDIGLEMGHEQSVVQQAQDKLDFSNVGQENDHSQDYHYEQSHKFKHQENQRDLKDLEIFNHLQQSRRHHYNKQDQISMWDQGVVNGGIEQNPHNSMSQLDKPSQFESPYNNFDYEKFWDQLTSNTQQTNKIPGTTNDQSNTYFRSDRSYLNLFPKDENSFQIPDKLYEINNGNINTNSHKKENFTNSNGYSHINTFQRIPPNTAPLLSLWNKLDNIEQQSTLSDNRNIGEGNVFSHVYTSQNSLVSKQERTDDNNSTFTGYNYNQIKPHPENQVQVNAEGISQNNLNDTQIDKESPQDLGRGDIGPEDVPDVEDKKPLETSGSEQHTTQNRNNTTEKPLQPSLLSVSGLTPENSQVHKNNENNISLANLQELEHKNMEHFDSATLVQQQNLVGQENLEQQTLHNFGQQENLGQHSLQDFGQHVNLEQQNLDHFGQQEHLEQNLQDFGQQANLQKQNFEEFGQQENLRQQNLQDFGQHENLEHQDFEQANLDNFKQENLEQQNLQDFGIHENLEQQNIPNFGQQENLEQQNLQEFGQHENLEQHNIPNIGQENLEQQNLQDFGQHENLEQQNIPNIGQEENLEQQNLQDFGQHENLEQQNIQNFGQQENLEPQNLQDFGKHENLEQHNIPNIGQENLEQQNLQNFGQQENLEQQNLQNFAQQENSDQQNLQHFGQHEKLEQQNIPNFGKQENLEQQNLQDFGQHENLEQQNLQNFAHQEYLEQQNLQDFGQHENLEQQNLQNFAHQGNLEQQNLQDFGQHENLEQQNLQNFAHQGNLEQQNLQDFGEQANLGQQHLEKFELENFKQNDLHNFGQPGNLEQQYTNAQDFGQNNQNLDQQNKLTLEQLSQSSKPNFKYTQQQTYPKNNMKPQIDLPHPEEVEEIKQDQNHNNELQSIPLQNQNTVGVLIERANEKPGFWKSVGNKFSNAKSKIASWFKS